MSTTITDMDLDELNFLFDKLETNKGLSKSDWKRLRSLDARMLEMSVTELRTLCEERMDGRK